MNGYGFEMQGKIYGPSGVIETPDVNAYNKELEAREIEIIRTAPDRLMLYIGNNGDLDTVQTWLGTSLGFARLGHKVSAGLFGYGSYKRSITVRIFGTLYHGWFFQSSGDYCRLRKAKNQTVKYAATTVLRKGGAQ